MLNTTLKLKPFQREGVDFLLEQYHCLLADDMGLGKTIQVIGAVNRASLVTGVVICPANVKFHWVRKMAEFFTVPHNVYMVRDGKDNIPPSAEIIVVNYDLLVDIKGERVRRQSRIAKQLKARGEQNGFDFAVIDEVHFLKNMAASRTKKVLGKHSFLHHARYKWALTGTPVPNRPSEFYPLLRTLAPHCIEPYLTWRQYGDYFCNGRQDLMGWNAKGASNVEELSERVEPFMLRRAKEDVLDQLPAKVETIIELDVKVPADLDTEHTATARRILAETKIPGSIKYIKEVLNQADKVVVFAHHRVVIETLVEKLSDYGAVILYGGMTTEQKQGSVDDFITNPQVKVIVAQTIAGGTGVDGLQGVCSHCVFIELDWSPGVMDQAVDRLRRIGQKDTVFVHYIAVPNSLDTDMKDILRRKRSIINRLIKPKEYTKMSLEEQLERIAVALETIAQSEKKEAVADAPAPAKKKAAPAKKKAAPAPAKPEFTEKDVLDSATKFVTSTSDRAGNKKIIVEKIWPMFGVESLASLDPSDYKEAIAQLSKNPSEFQDSGALDELDI